MFDIGFPELILVAIVGLLVIGPERLPEALRTLGLWLGRMRRSFVAVKAEIEKEIGMDEVRRQLHNEQIMEEMKRIEAEVKGSVDDARTTFNEATNAIDPKGASPAAAASTAAAEASAIDAEPVPTPGVSGPAAESAESSRPDSTTLDSSGSSTEPSTQSSATQTGNPQPAGAAQTHADREQANANNG
jgi:sec-independent protein translocase protein TatB